MTNETPSKPPEKRCVSQKGTDGETIYPQDSAWEYFILSNHSEDDALVEYTEKESIAIQFSRPILIGVQVDDAWCFELKDFQEQGVMMYRRAPLVKIYGMTKISKPILTQPTQQELGYFTQFMQLAKAKKVNFLG